MEEGHLLTFPLPLCSIQFIYFFPQRSQNILSSITLNFKIIFHQHVLNVEWVQNFPAMNWTLNYNYWTSGTRQGSCLGNYSWCDPGNATLLGGNVTWEPGSPDNKLGLEECLHLKIRSNGSGMWLTDKNCSARFIYACQAVCFVEKLQGGNESIMV
jgi:hypothetical protein